MWKLERLNSEYLTIRLPNCKVLDLSGRSRSPAVRLPSLSLIWELPCHYARINYSFDRIQNSENEKKKKQT